MRMREVAGRRRTALAAKRILHRAQMPDHRDIEASRRRAMRRTQRRSRLVHDANLGPKPCRHSPPRKLLQRDQAVGARERMQSRRRIAIDVVVDVGAAQRDDKRPIRITLAKIADAVGAAPRVERNHQIRGRSIVPVGNLNVMAEFAQDPRPSHGRGPFPDRDDERAGVIITIRMSVTLIDRPSGATEDELATQLHDVRMRTRRLTEDLSTGS